MVPKVGVEPTRVLARTVFETAASAIRHSGSCRQICSSQELQVWSGREDLNLRPPEPHSGALPGCATARNGWQARQDLNLQPAVLETAALPIELLASALEIVP